MSIFATGIENVTSQRPFRFVKSTQRMVYSCKNSSVGLESIAIFKKSIIPIYINFEEEACFSDMRLCKKIKLENKCFNTFRHY